MDGIDAALVDFIDDTATLIAHHSHTIPEEILAELQHLISLKTADKESFTELDKQLGLLFASACITLLDANNIKADEISAIGSHGQTVFHAPKAEPPFTLQIGNANIIAKQTGITTIADFRRNDMAAGGQGAPLVPAFHNAAFRSADKNRVILNIGGIANITVLPANSNTPVTGFDTGPGNTLLDLWVNKHLGQPVDCDGQWASGGVINRTLLEALLDDNYFKAPPPKSTGREHFNLCWLQQHQLDDTAQNIQATLCQLTIESIACAIETYAKETEELFVCGGGVYNPVLMQGLAKRLATIKVASTAALGIEPEWVEAVAFAWLAKQTLEGKPGNLPSVTGARHSVVLGETFPVGTA